MEHITYLLSLVSLRAPPLKLQRQHSQRRKKMPHNYQTYIINYQLTTCSHKFSFFILKLKSLGILLRPISEQFERGKAKERWETEDVTQNVLIYISRRNHHYAGTMFSCHLCRKAVAQRTWYLERYELQFQKRP